MGSVQSENLIPLGILVLSGILNGAYFFPIVYRAFFKPLPYSHMTEKGEASKAMVIPLVVTAILSLLLGIYPDLFFNFFKMAVSISSQILGGIGS
jgi:multicomponent Na+:H+ antiporter subunit D